MQKELTKIQQNILDYLLELRSKSKTPTLAEIAKHLGYKNRSTVQQHLQAIEKKESHPGRGGFCSSTPELRPKPAWIYDVLVLKRWTNAPTPPSNNINSAKVQLGRVGTAIDGLTALRSDILLFNTKASSDSISSTLW